MKTSQSTVANSSAALGRSGLGASTGQRLPVPPRERKPALAALAVLLILGGALTSAYLVMASGQRVSAIQITQSVEAGQQIPASALREVPVGDTGILFINWNEHAKVTGTVAAVRILPGTLLTNQMMNADSNLTRGRVIVGLALKPGQFPATGLDKGLRVSLYAVGGNTSGGVRAGTVLSTDAIVKSFNPGGGDRVRSDQTMVDVAVPPGEAPLLTQAAAAGAVALALVPEGTKVSPGVPPKQQSPAEKPTDGTGSTTNPTGG